ncbi:putative sialin-like [Penaeus vannamei]|uniref:Putative sialin-like n=1 Tax=Penaeus vannamei TaxID=6689 RepID=A0A423SYY4_PENVA|nr:putative sialin-like [Penaeus vannamei]
MSNTSAILVTRLRNTIFHPRDSGYKSRVDDPDGAEGEKTHGIYHISGEDTGENVHKEADADGGGCWGVRYTLCLLLFLGITQIYMTRVCLSIAITGEFDWDATTQGLILGSFFYGYVAPTSWRAGGRGPGWAPRVRAGRGPVVPPDGGVAAVRLRVQGTLHRQQGPAGPRAGRHLPYDSHDDGDLDSPPRPSSGRNHRLLG